MKIECTLQRKGGTVVELPGKTYHFKPQEDGRHIAEVEDESHIETFLRIREAYRILRSPGAAAVEETLPPAVDDGKEGTAGNTGPVATSTAFPPTFTINGKVYTLDAIASRAFIDSGLPFEDWNTLDDEHRATKIEIVLDALEAGEITIDPVDDEPNPVVDERATLDAQYKERFGKLPPSNMKLETLKAKLAAGAE